MVILVRKAKRSESGGNIPIEEKYYADNGKWVSDVSKAKRFTRNEALDKISSLSDKYFYTLLWENDVVDAGQQNGNIEPNEEVSDGLEIDEGNEI